MFFFLENSSLLFSITRSSSFSVIHVSVNIKNNVEKDKTLLLFFLSKSRPCDCFLNKTLSCIWVAIPVEWIILHRYACGADGRSGGRAVGRCTVTWLPNFLGLVVFHIFYPWCSAARASRARAPLLINLHHSIAQVLKHCREEHYNFVVKGTSILTGRYFIESSTTQAEQLTKATVIKNLVFIWMTRSPGESLLSCFSWLCVKFHILPEIIFKTIAYPWSFSSSKNFGKLSVEWFFVAGTKMVRRNSQSASLRGLSRVNTLLPSGSVGVVDSASSNCKAMSWKFCA